MLDVQVLKSSHAETMVGLERDLQNTQKRLRAEEMLRERRLRRQLKGYGSVSTGKSRNRGALFTRSITFLMTLVFLNYLW